VLVLLEGEEVAVLVLRVNKVNKALQDLRDLQVLQVQVDQGLTVKP
jgi:hypothetical protein